MSINLFQSVKDLFPKDFTNKVANILSERPEYVSAGVSGIIPTVLTGLMQKGSSVEGLSLLSKHSNDATDVKFQSSLPKIITGKNYEKYEKLFDSAEDLFGEKLSDLTHKVSINSGLRETSANWLIRLVTPTALGVLGEHLKKNKLGFTDAANIMANEKDSIISSIPEEYNLSSAFGVNNLHDIGDKFTNSLSIPKVADAPKEVEQFVTEHIPTIAEHIPEIKEHFTTIPEPIEPIKEEIPVYNDPAPYIPEMVKPEIKVQEPVQEFIPEPVIKTPQNLEPAPVRRQAKKDPALKWKVISWVLLIIGFLLLLELFSILPPMFRLN